MTAVCSSRACKETRLENDWVRVEYPDGTIIEFCDDGIARCMECGYPTQPIGKPQRHRKHCGLKMVSEAELKRRLKALRELG